MGGLSVTHQVSVDEMGGGMAGWRRGVDGQAVAGEDWGLLLTCYLC